MPSSATLSSTCGWCRQPLDENGPSPDFCGEEHQLRWLAHQQLRQRVIAHQVAVLAPERLRAVAAAFQPIGAAFAHLAIATAETARALAKLRTDKTHA
jgi:hypothetical protein